MKNIITILIILLISNTSYSQDISGSWRWSLDNGRRHFEIDLIKKYRTVGSAIPTNFKGKHCGVFEDGARMDCTVDEFTISLDKISENVFTGTILSAYSRSIHDIKVTYLPASGQLRWEITKERPGQIYMPKNVILQR
ncbi:hypothetical protein [Algoriphagus sp. Y33]|uniref:hypothetical protein n=1 Tax=Algoriphagus sp. Y33 TaxID=2772483 RepID=UPI00177BCFA4|nr:hypothetical protein [Algoriphagus sp. Y33]